jgi:DNA-binding MltR family transcriptional regulator
MEDVHNFDRVKVQAFVEEGNVAIKELMKESDRGAVLVGVAYLDELLVRLFKEKMLLTQKLSEYLFESSGPLSTLSSRIRIAYCLGWIGPATFQDLDLLRKIRNDFAHLHSPLTFDDPSVRSRCRELEAFKQFDIATFPKPRDQFICSVVALSIRLQEYRNKAKIPELGTDPVLTRQPPPT